jgi:hypothetical protein
VWINLRRAFLEAARELGCYGNKSEATIENTVAINAAMAKHILDLRTGNARTFCSRFLDAALLRGLAAGENDLPRKPRCERGAGEGGGQGDPLAEP